MPQMFKHSVKVTAIRRQTVETGSLPQFFSREGDALEITDCRIRYEVTKNLSKQPNKTTIYVHNLAETTRTSLERGIIGISLHAGFGGVFKLIASGDLRRAFSKREGRDIITVLQVNDGYRAYAHAFLSKSYRPPVTVARVLEDAAATMGLKLPDKLLDDARLRQSVPDGVSVNGPTRDVLTTFLRPYGYGWSTQDGVLQILRDADVRPGPGEGLLINADTPIVGTPERTYPDKAGGKSELKFDVLLYPEIGPGSLIRLESEFIKMNAKTTDVAHKGDNRGGQMITSVQARPLAP